MATKVTSPNGYLQPPSTWPGFNYLINAGARAVTTLDSAVVADRTYTVGTDESVVLADSTTAAITVTLPPVATSAGMVLTVKNIAGTNGTVLDGNLSEEIEGATTYTVMDAAGDVVTIVCDGTAWHILSAITAP